MSEQTFRDLSKKVVERFLQTVVVLDDGAFMDSPGGVPTVQEPDKNVPILGEEPEDAATSPEASGPFTRNLDAQELITNFAERGLVCAVLAPWKDKNGSEATITAARRADIVILDWKLGDKGEQATSIIRSIIKKDEATGGRLRMIVVYTADPDLEAIREAVRAAMSDVLSDLEAIDRPGKVLALKAPHTRLLFIRKGFTSFQAGSISESDLPERLIDEFVDVGKGILANVVLGCVAAIREETHRVLARFHPRLDAPFLTHRILLTTPGDAEDYAVDLLSSEFLAVLQSQAVGTKYAGSEAIRLALTEREGQDVKFRLMTTKDPEKEAKTITVDELMKLVDKGPAGLKKISNIPNGQGPQDKLHERIYLLLSEDLETGITLHDEFARVSAHAREQALVSSTYRAKLSLGSIVREGEEYFVCIQPACDALRLKKSTQFIFASLSPDTSSDTSSFDVVVRNSEGEDIRLKLNARASKIRTASFMPYLDTGIVLSSVGEPVQTFRSTKNEEFVWMCDLRTSFAQSFVHRIANNLSRIGLDEFEWQRRHSPV